MPVANPARSVATPVSTTPSPARARSATTNVFSVWIASEFITIPDVARRNCFMPARGAWCRSGYSKALSESQAPTEQAGLIHDETELVATVTTEKNGIARGERGLSDRGVKLGIEEGAVGGFEVAQNDFAADDADPRMVT